MLVEYHQRVPCLQRYGLQHEDMVGHQVSLDDPYPLVLTELPEDLPKVGPYVVAGDFVPILRREQELEMKCDLLRASSGLSIRLPAASHCARAHI